SCMERGIESYFQGANTSILKQARRFCQQQSGDDFFGDSRCQLCADKFQHQDVILCDCVRVLAAGYKHTVAIAADDDGYTGYCTQPTALDQWMSRCVFRASNAALTVLGDPDHNVVFTGFFGCNGLY